MNFKKLLMIPLLAAMPAIAGCGGDDCKSVCEDRNDCSGVEKQDCDKTCEESDKMAEDMGCKDQYDDVWDCAGDEDVCKEDSTACAEEVSKWLSCATAYCTAHSTAAACTGGT